MAGPGVVTFTGTNTYTGATTISAGKLVLTAGADISSSEALVMQGGVLDVSALASYTFNEDQPVTFAGGSMKAGNLILAGAFMTNTIANPAAPFVNTTTLTFGEPPSALTIGYIPPFANYPRQFPLIQYQSISGTLNIGNLFLPAGFSGYLSNNAAAKTIDLVLTNGIVPLTWTGTAGASWDVLTTTNWLDTFSMTRPLTFENGAPVSFDDTAPGAANITLGGVVSPGSVSVSNSALDYTISGPGQMAGTMSLTKSGTNLLTINTTNTFTGGIVLSNGPLAFVAGGLGGAGAVTFDGGSLRWLDGNAQDLSARINIPASQTAIFDIADTNSVTFATGLSTNTGGGFTKVGTGTLTLTRVGFGGSPAIAVQSGTLQENVRAALGYGPISLSPNAALVVDIGGDSMLNPVSGSGVINVVEGANWNVIFGNSLAGFTGVLNCPGGRRQFRQGLHHQQQCQY